MECVSEGIPLLVLQCCKSKTGTTSFGETRCVEEVLTEASRCSLERGRSEIGVVHAPGLDDAPALGLYSGHFYRYPGLKRRLAQAIVDNAWDVIVLSGGYGLVHALQPIRPYEQEMNRRIATRWMDAGLPLVLRNYVVATKPSHVIGIFSKSAEYRRIFRKAFEAPPEGMRPVASYATVNVRGTGAVLQKQAALVEVLLQHGLEHLPSEIEGSHVDWHPLRI